MSGRFDKGRCVTRCMKPGESVESRAYLAGVREGRRLEKLYWKPRYDALAYNVAARPRRGR